MSLGGDGAPRLSFVRRRVGRGGRVWLDRTSARLPRLLDARLGFAPTSATQNDDDDDDDDALWDDVGDTLGPRESDDDATVPATFMSVGLPCYTPQDLLILNGMGDYHQRCVSVSVSAPALRAGLASDTRSRRELVVEQARTGTTLAPLQRALPRAVVRVVWSWG